jgi:hypothetical protein
VGGGGEESKISSATNKQTNNDDTCQGNKEKENDKPSAAEHLECKTE